MQRSPTASVLLVPSIIFEMLTAEFLFKARTRIGIGVWHSSPILDPLRPIRKSARDTVYACACKRRWRAANAARIKSEQSDALKRETSTVKS